MVVYHYNPTSNRNHYHALYFVNGVVYHYNPTSNRNGQKHLIRMAPLYIIIILYQTATLLYTVPT